MDGKKLLIRNIASNSVGYFVSIVITFLLAPFVVHQLGDARYGIWTLLIALSGYYGLLDLGVRGAVGHYIARYMAQDDEEGVNRTVNTSLVLLGAAGGLVLVVTLLVVILLPRMFELAAADVQRTRIAAAIMGVQFAITLPMATFSSIVYACRRLDLSNLIGISSRLVTAGGIVWALSQGFGLVGLAVATTIGPVLGWVASFLVSRRLLPFLRSELARFSKEFVREIAGFSAFSFIGRLAAQFIEYTDALVIGIFLRDPVAVTFYAIGHNIVPYFRNMIGALTLVFTPYATAADARGDREGLRRIQMDGTRWAFFLAAWIAGGILFLGADFLGLWMGPRYISDDAPFTPSSTILTVLAIATLARMFQHTGLQTLNGMREVKFMAKVGVVEAVSNLVLSIVLIHFFGILGVAFGTLLPVLYTQCYWEPNYLLRKLELGWGRYLRYVLPGAAATMLIMAGTYLVVGRHMHVAHWGDFLLKGMVVTAPALFGGLLVNTTRPERVHLLSLVGIRRG